LSQLNASNNISRKHKTKSDKFSIKKHLNSKNNSLNSANDSRRFNESLNSTINSDQRYGYEMKSQKRVNSLENIDKTTHKYLNNIDLNSNQNTNKYQLSHIE